jgi:hypothetical protein
MTFAKPKLSPFNLPFIHPSGTGGLKECVNKKEV